VNASATKSDDGRTVVLKLVNTSERSLNVRALIEGEFPIAGAVFKLVAPDSLSARNTMEKPNVVRAVDAKVDIANNALQLSLPRWSVGVVTVTRQ
jgi:alpha-L-arabinofuranosidase